MPLTDVEKNRRFRERLYEAGYKPTMQWIKRKEQRGEVIDFETFTRKMKKLTAGWDERKLSKFLFLLLCITEGKKERSRVKER